MKSQSDNHCGRDGGFSVAGRDTLRAHGNGRDQRPTDRGPAAEIPSALEIIARRVARLAPSHRDPERFHVEKSEIVFELRKLSKKGKYK